MRDIEESGKLFALKISSIPSVTRGFWQALKDVEADRAGIFRNLQ